jgi:small subunit ribosomal protein S4e
MHQKRNSIPKTIPITRKGTKYIVIPRGSKQNSVPLLIVLRDILQMAKNRKEVKKALHDNLIEVNKRIVKDEKLGMSLFDTLTLARANKNYRLIIGPNGKFDLKEISDKEARQKTAKVMNKRMLKGRNIQLNLSDGRNYLSDIKCQTQDSVLIDFKEKKISGSIPLKENGKAFVVNGKHAGEEGIIMNISKEKKMVSLKRGKESSEVPIKYIIMVE